MKHKPSMSEYFMTASAVVVFGFLVVASFGGMALIFSGIAVLGWQCLSYLQAGAWMPLNVLDVVAYGVDWDWLSRPTDWHGAHQILSSVPASAGLVLVGFVVMGIATSAMER